MVRSLTSSLVRSSDGPCQKLNRPLGLNEVATENEKSHHDHNSDVSRAECAPTFNVRFESAIWIPKSPASCFDGLCDCVHLLDSGATMLEIMHKRVGESSPSFAVNC